MNNTESKLSRIRLLDEAYAEIKKLDPDTAVTKYYVRQLMLSGKVRCVTAGRKRLVDLDSLIEYLSTPENNATVEAQNAHIRRVV